jgi:hypothetical protein
VIIDHGKVIAAGTMTELVDQTVGRFRLVTLRLDAPLDASTSLGVSGWRTRSGRMPTGAP